MRRRFIDVAYEDKDIIVVNKPRGIEVQPFKNDKNSRDGSRTLTEEVKSYLLSKYSGAKGAYVKALHRLDKDTTGLVIFARSKAGEKMVNDIKEHKIRRIYTAIVEGAVENEEGTIDKPLVKGDFGYGRKVGLAMENEKDSMPAITHYRVRERYLNATLLTLQLETGRTHQIRVHLSSMGHPIVGDKVYNQHGKIKFPRQALHASEITFRHPSNGRKIELASELPPDMEALVDKLRESV